MQMGGTAHAGPWLAGPFCLGCDAGTEFEMSAHTEVHSLRALLPPAASGSFWLLISAIVAACLMGVGILFAYAATGLDRAPIRANVAAAYAAGELSEQEYLHTNTVLGAHQFNDCMILLMVMDDRGSRVQRALSPSTPALPVTDARPCIAARDMAANGPPRDREDIAFYHRYIHGYVPTTTVLLSVLPVSWVRNIFSLVAFTLVAGLLAFQALVLLRRLQAGVSNATALVKPAFMALASLAVLLFYGLPYYAMTFSHFQTDVWLFVYLWVVALVDFRRLGLGATALLHAVFGFITMDFEFLIGGIPLGVCLILFAFAAHAVGDARVRMAQNGVLSVLAFMVAAVTAYIVKQVVTVQVFGPDFIGPSASKLEDWFFGDGTTPLHVAWRLLRHAEYVGVGWLYLGAALILGAVALIVASLARLWSQRRQLADKPMALLLVLSAFVVPVWYCIFEYHSRNHAHFTVRYTVGMMFPAVALFLVVYRDAFGRAMRTVALMLTSPSPTESDAHRAREPADPA